jgi:hypothetical protein
MDINVKWLVNFFAIQKGEDDIRLVYGATAHTLNGVFILAPYH